MLSKIKVSWFLAFLLLCLLLFIFLMENGRSSGIFPEELRIIVDTSSSDNITRTFVATNIGGRLWDENFNITFNYQGGSDDITGSAFGGFGFAGIPSDPSVVLAYGLYRISHDEIWFEIDYRNCGYGYGRAPYPNDDISADIIIVYQANEQRFFWKNSASQLFDITNQRKDMGYFKGLSPNQSCFQDLSDAPPPSPLKLAIANFGQYGQSPRLGWEASAGATSYNVYRKLSSDPNWALTLNTRSIFHTDNSISMSMPNAPGANEFLYQITAVNSAGESTSSNTVSTFDSRWLKTASELSEMTFAEMENIPAKFSLAQNYPNPFNPQTELRYALPRAGYVELSIANLLGQPIRTLLAENQSVGWHHKMWDGRDEEGRQVASGIYLYRVVVQPNDGSANFTEVRKLSLLR